MKNKLLITFVVVLGITLVVGSVVALAGDIVVSPPPLEGEKSINNNAAPAEEYSPAIEERGGIYPPK